MTKYSKRIDELEIGDIIRFSSNKQPKIVKTIELLKDKPYRKLSFQDIHGEHLYYDDIYVTYLGNNKEKIRMKEQKVDYSVLYPYFDSLANDEVTLKYTNIPNHVKQNLKLIHELFEGVLDLTLEEVKTLYFERKMSKQKPTKTKKVKDLCIGDKVYFSLSCDSYEAEETITKLQEFSDTQIRIITEQDTEAIFRKDKVVTLMD